MYLFSQGENQFNQFQHTTDLQPMTSKISRELYGQNVIIEIDNGVANGDVEHLSCCQYTQYVSDVDA